MILDIQTLDIPEVKLLKVKRYEDHRGFFSETYSQQDMELAGLGLNFVQDNQSLSTGRGTLRGLHFQCPPFAQDKLVRVLRGRIWDVVVDIRVGSPTFGQHVSAEISASEWNQIFVPVGFAHGMLTLEADTEIFYKVTNFYSPECDRGLLWNDPRLKIDWPVTTSELVLSEKDKVHPRLDDLPVYFKYQGEQ
jgi:dTDP-4-dehydrorhamnose 3,5-epimerase